MELKIDTGVEEFRVNGRGVLRFNPADPNLYHRFFAAIPMLEQYDAVTRQQLRDLAQNIFQMDLASLSAVGRVKAAADYSAWLGR